MESPWKDPRLERPASHSGAQQAASKGHPAPWHSNLQHKPYADFELHTFQFGHAPSSNREFKQRAAGTWHAQPVQKQLAGKSHAYTTKKFKVTASVCTTSIFVHLHPAALTVELAQ